MLAGFFLKICQKVGVLRRICSFSVLYLTKMTNLVLKNLLIKIDNYKGKMTDSNNGYNQLNQKLKKWGFEFFGQTKQTPKAEENTLERGYLLETAKSFPLPMASVGERLAIAKLKGTEGTVHRLIGMGLVPGTELQIISIGNGSVIVGLGDNRIGLGAGMAQKIMCTNV